MHVICSLLIITVRSPLVFHFAGCVTMTWSLVHAWVIQYEYLVLNQAFGWGCSTCFKCFSAPTHLKWNYQLISRPDNKPFAWIRCAGAEKHLKHAELDVPWIRIERHRMKEIWFQRPLSFIMFKYCDLGWSADSSSYICLNHVWSLVLIVFSMGYLHDFRVYW